MRHQTELDLFQEFSQAEKFKHKVEDLLRAHTSDTKQPPQAN